MTDLSVQEYTAEKNIVWVVYILHALGFFTGGLTSIVAVIVNYIKISDMKSQISVSHFRWQIRTFWWGLLWSLVSLALAYFVIGLLGFFILFLWFVYRLIIGMVSLHKEKGMYEAR